MKLNVPFVKNRDWECGQACVAMMIKYFYPDFEPDFKEFNKIIHQKSGKYTHPPQLGILLDAFEVKVKVFSSDDIKLSGEDSEQFKRWFGKDYEYEMKYIDLQSFDWMVREFRKRNLFEVRQTKFEELLGYFRKGYLIGIPIDWNSLVGKKGHYEGHFVLITGVSGDYIFIHDPDVGPFIRYPISRLKTSWKHPAIAQDCIVAYGKK